MSSSRFFLEQEQPATLSDEAQQTIDRGEQYATAVAKLCLNLADISDTDLAIAFDAGAGADAVAFSSLGFQHAIITNSPSIVYQMAGGEEREAKVQKEIAPRFPRDTRISSLGVTDWLQFPSFAPRLATMLRMAPRCFSDEENPGAFLAVFLPYLRKLQPQQSVVLSAMNDHPQSEAAFSSFEHLLVKENIPHQFFLNEQTPPDLTPLGSRILVIQGKKRADEAQS
jgi:hypothetical protein